MKTIDESVASRFSGFCFEYDKYIPPPPDDLLTLAVKLSKKKVPDLVVDLGCGTGLSTRPWSKYAAQVIGIDPSRDMLKVATDNTTMTNVVYWEGSGNRTLLESEVADIVTCSNSIHWMEPESTVTEISRVLKNEGVFVVYGYYYPLFAEAYELTRFYEVWRKNLDKLEYEAENQNVVKWSFQKSLQAFDDSRLFRYARRHYMHSKLEWRPVDVIGFLEAHVGVNSLRDKGFDDNQLLLSDFRKLLADYDEIGCITVYFTHSLYIGIK